MKRVERTHLESHPSGQPVTPPFFLTAREAAALLRVSEITLGRWRIDGSGPAYRKFGRRVLYARADLIAWADAQTRLSTSEPRAACTRKPSAPVQPPH